MDLDKIKSRLDDLRKEVAQGFSDQPLYKSGYIDAIEAIRDLITDLYVDSTIKVYARDVIRVATSDTDFELKVKAVTSTMKNLIDELAGDNSGLSTPS